MSSCLSAERYDCARPDISASFQQIRHQGDGGPLEWSCSFIKKRPLKSLLYGGDICREQSNSSSWLSTFLRMIHQSKYRSFAAQWKFYKSTSWLANTFFCALNKWKHFFFFLKSILTSVSIKTCTSASTVLTALAFAWKTSADKMKGHRQKGRFSPNQIRLTQENLPTMKINVKRRCDALIVWSRVSLSLDTVTDEGCCCWWPQNEFWSLQSGLIWQFTEKCIHNNQDKLHQVTRQWRKTHCRHNKGRRVGRP